MKLFLFEFGYIFSINNGLPLSESESMVKNDDGLWALIDALCDPFSVVGSR